MPTSGPAAGRTLLPCSSSRAPRPRRGRDRSGRRPASGAPRRVRAAARAVAAPPPAGHDGHPPTPYAEISATLGIPVGSIGPTRQRCLEHLRRSAALAPHLEGHGDMTDRELLRRDHPQDPQGGPRRGAAGRCRRGRLLGAPDLVGLREELANLEYDSLVDDEGLLVRSSDQHWRSASFWFGDATLDIEILDDERTVVGLLLPPEPAEVEIRQFDANYLVHTDDSGRFRCVIAPGAGAAAHPPPGRGDRDCLAHPLREGT